MASEKIKPSKRKFHVKEISLLLYPGNSFQRLNSIPWNSCTINLFNHFPIDILLFGFGGDFAFSNSASVYIPVRMPSWTWAYVPGCVPVY